MRKGTHMVVGLFIGVVVLALAPAALAGSAVDQYTEGIPSAGGQKSSNQAVNQSGTATISPQTGAQLDKSRKGRAAERAANLTAPSHPGAVGSDSSGSGDGLGIFLPLILAATLVVGIGIFYTRRRLGATSD
jgi:hypothetical protein